MLKRIVVVGAGFAGMWSALSAARHLEQIERSDIEVLLIAPAPELHIRPRLYEKEPHKMKASLTEILDIAGVKYVQGFVNSINVEKREISFVSVDGNTTSSTLGYDRLILAAGSNLFSPPIPGLKEHAFNTDQLINAVELDKHLSSLAHKEDSLARNTVVVAGAGFTGIEIASEMPSRLRDILGSDAVIRVILAERNSEVGPDLGPGPRPVILEALNHLGVSFKLGSAVSSIDQDGITLENGEHIATNTVIWSGGARANKLTAQIPVPKDNFGRLHVDCNLKVEGIEGVFATGDCAYAATDNEGHYSMMSCQHAMNLGRSAGHNAAADLIGEQPIPYSQPKYVTCLDLGPWGAVYTEGWDRQVKLSGSEAKELKTKINSEWIYPPSGNKSEIFNLADPRRIVVA